MKKSIIIIALSLMAMHTFAIRDTRNRDLKDFSAIVIADCFEVRYTQTKEYRVYIDTLDGDILPRTVTTVQNDTLFISYTGDRIERVLMHVSSPKLTYVNVSGMSAFIAENGMKASQAELFVSGTGSLTLNSLQTTLAHVNKSGTGAFKMTGDLLCDSLIAEVEGAGAMTLNNIKSTIANISVSGTCGCSVKGDVDVTKFIATMNGAGGIAIEGKIEASEKVWLEMIGTGSVKAKGRVTTPLLNVRLKGIGSVNAPAIQVDRADVILKGIGTVTLGGNAKMINKDVTGFGQVKTDNLVTEPETAH